jgi:hypothetical protein
MSEYFQDDPQLEPARSVPTIEQAKDTETRQIFGRAMAAARHEGWIPEAAERHTGRLLSTNVYEHSEIPESQGFTLEENYVYDKDVDMAVRTFDVFVNPSKLDDPKTVTRAFVDIIAGEEHAGADGDPTAGPVVTRGMEQVFGYTPGGIAMNRAVTAHYADSLLYGDVQITDPSAPSRKGAENIEDRSLLHVLATGGKKPVDVRLIGAAFFEDKAVADRLGKQSAQAQFAKRVAKAFPFTNVIQEISELEPEDGQTSEEMIAAYAAGLAERAAQYRLRAKVASLASRHLRPKRSGR